MSVVATDLAGAVEDAAAHLYVWALKDIPQDLRDALASAQRRETSVTGQRVLQTILRNVDVAAARRSLMVSRPLNFASARRGDTVMS